MNDRIGWRALARYLAGESSPAEAAGIEAWAASDPRHAEALGAARRAWGAVRAHDAPPDAEAAWQALAGRIQPGERRRRRVALWAGGLVAAAALATLLALPALRGRHPAPGAQAEFRTGPSQVLTVRLADGSVVRLAPLTRLRATVAATRQAWLEGTAFFAIARDGRPFTVHTAAGDARVLGTRFELQAEQRRVRLVVLEGRVALTAAAGGEVVSAGEMSVAEAGRAPSPPHAADVAGLNGWMEGVLIFQATPLAAAAREIERQYGVPVRLSEPELGQRTVNAVFDHQPLPTVATTLCRIAAVSCQVQDTVVWIRP